MLNRRNLIAATAALAMAMTACATQQARVAPTGNNVDATFDTADDDAGHARLDDRYQHFVVLTDTSDTPDDATAAAGVEGASDSAGSGDDDRELTFELSGSHTLHTATGDTVDVELEPGSAVAIAVATETEARAVAAHADTSVVAMLIADVSGSLGGEIGARYVYTEHGIYELDGTPARNTDSDDETPTVAEPSVAEPAADAGSTPDAVIGTEVDRRVVGEIRDLPDTVDAAISGPGVIAVTTRSDGSDIEEIPGVAAIEEEVTFGFSDDPYQSYQWHIANTGAAAQANGQPGTAGVDTGAPAAWGVATGSGITVAVIDSGIQADHPDLSARIKTNTGEVCGNGADDDGNGFVDDCAGWDFGDNDANPAPNVGTTNYGHGTHVAGIIAAPRNGTGVVGIAPDARIMNLKANRSDGQVTLSAVVAAINYAVANGADVINLSLGTDPGAVARSGVTSLETAISNALSAGVIVVAAAGNHGADITSSPVWPASLSNYHPQITVGATTNTDARASFSNRGGPLSLWAPGDQILSTGYGSNYEWRSGTSMATPMVAGAAAVLLQTGPYTPGGMRSHLADTAVASAAGPRLSLSAALGVSGGGSTPGTTTVTYRGANTLLADEVGTLAIDVVSSGATTATQARLSVATLDEGQVAAVDGLTTQVSLPAGGTSNLTSDINGAFPTLPLGSASTVTFNAQMTLPEGEYAFVTELLNQSGQRVGGVQVAYIGVDHTATTVTTTTLPQNPITTTTQPGSGGGGTTPTTQPGGGGSTPTTQPGSGGGSTPTTAPATPTTQPGGGGSTPTTQPGGGSTPTTQPGSGGGSTPTTQPGGGGTTPTTQPGGGDGGSTPTTQPGGGSTPTTTTPAAPTTTQPGQGGGGTTPPTTTPAPDPDTDGPWSLETMDPRLGRTDGNEHITLTGKFPDWVPVYVWFGELGIKTVHYNDGETLRVATPSVSSTGVVDVSVKFRTSQGYELTLSDAFTFYTPDPGPGGGGSTPTTQPGQGGGGSTPTTQPGQGGGGGGGSTPTTQPGQGGGSTPTTQPGQGGGSSTPTTQPGQGGGGSTPTTQPGGGGGGSTPTTTAPSWVRARGNLTLRPPAAGSSLAMLSVAGWPSAGCQAATCAASNL